VKIRPIRVLFLSNLNDLNECKLQFNACYFVQTVYVSKIITFTFSFKNLNFKKMIQSVLTPLFEMNALKVNGLLTKMTQENSAFRIHAAAGSVGFYMRHIAEAQIILSKMFFGTETNLPYGKPLTLRVPNDDGRAYDLAETQHLMQTGNELLLNVIKTLPEADWHKPKTTVFGEKTPFQGIAMIMNHNAHHCGQIELTIKKGA
jgi:uncharacterized damage-inducible protein DinB